MGDSDEREGLATLEFVRRVFGEVEESAWLLHVATGQVLWANRRAMERCASVSGDGRIEDVHATLLAAHDGSYELRAQPLNVDGYALTLHVAAERSAVRTGRGGETSTVDERSSKAWWISERKLSPTLAAVAVLLVHGATAGQVAQELDVTIASAKTYIKRVRRRLPPSERWWIARRIEIDT